ncbi:MAG: hypothetical protein AAF614_42550 [Chloroflexota bacterium]
MALEGSVVLIGTIRLLPAPYGSATDRSVHITLANIEQTGLGLRMPATVESVVQEQLNMPRLSPEAIREFSGRRFVLVEEANGDQQRVDLRLGLARAITLLMVVPLYADATNFFLLETRLSQVEQGQQRLQEVIRLSLLESC